MQHCAWSMLPKELVPDSGSNIELSSGASLSEVRILIVVQLVLVERGRVKIIAVGDASFRLLQFSKSICFWSGAVEFELLKLALPYVSTLLA